MKWGRYPVCRGRTSNNSMAFEIVGVLYRPSSSSCSAPRWGVDIDGVSVMGSVSPGPRSLGCLEIRRFSNLESQKLGNRQYSSPGGQPNRTEMTEPGPPESPRIVLARPSIRLRSCLAANSGVATLVGENPEVVWAPRKPEIATRHPESKSGLPGFALTQNCSRPKTDRSSWPTRLTSRPP